MRQHVLYTCLVALVVSANCSRAVPVDDVGAAVKVAGEAVLREVVGEDGAVVGEYALQETKAPEKVLEAVDTEITNAVSTGAMETAHTAESVIAGLFGNSPDFTVAWRRSLFGDDQIATVTTELLQEPVKEDVTDDAMSAEGLWGGVVEADSIAQSGPNHKMAAALGKLEKAWGGRSDEKSARLNHKAAAWMQREFQAESQESPSVLVDSLAMLLAESAPAKPDAAEKAQDTAGNSAKAKSQDSGHSLDTQALLREVLVHSAKEAAKDAVGLAAQAGKSLHDQIRASDRAVDQAFADQTFHAHGAKHVAKKLKASLAKSIAIKVKLQKKIARAANTAQFCALAWFRKLALHNGDNCGDLRKQYAKKGEILRIGAEDPNPSPPISDTATEGSDEQGAAATPSDPMPQQDAQEPDEGSHEETQSREGPPSPPRATHGAKAPRLHNVDATAVRPMRPLAARQGPEHKRKKPHTESKTKRPHKGHKSFDEDVDSIYKQVEEEESKSI